jgi:hypothetical protein
MATIALMIDVINQLNSPNPDRVIGPNRVTTIPPPASIKTHIANKNPKRPNFNEISSS